LGLLCFALALRDRGWRVTFLGADTPFPAIAQAAGMVGADIIVLAAQMYEALAGRDDDVRALAAHHPVALGGRAPSPDFARRADARLLPDDALRAADELGAGGN
jgi:methanogenic corrinoid protein MtbC1